MRPAFPSGFLAALLLAVSCGAPPLDTSGEVRLWSPLPDPAIKAAAAGLPGLVLAEYAGGTAWRQSLEAGEEGADLILADWSLELQAAGDSGLLVELSPWKPRLRSPRESSRGLGLKGTFLRGSPAYVLPVSLRPWGLYHDATLLSRLGIGKPRDLAGLEEAFAAAARAGLTPLALGASFGWPALAWVAILDIRANGAGAYARLIEGSRRFDDPSLMPVYEALGRWRDRGWISREAATTGWPESLAAVEGGKAAFVLLPSSASSRLASDARLSFSAVPGGAGGGELVSLRGFALAARAKAPEAALALADAYIAAGAQGQTLDPTAIPFAGSAKAAVSPGIRTAGLDILRAARDYLPPLDQALPAQAAYDTRQVMTRFFAPESDMDARALSAALAVAGRR